MTRRKKYFLAAGVFILILLLGWLAVPREPTHQGRPLSAWLQDLGSSDYQIQKSAQEAIRAMGPKAVPFLTQSLEQRNSAALRFYRGNALAQKWFRGWRQKVKWHEPVMESRNAARALSELGPGAEAAIPNLVAALSDYSPLVAQEAANTLGKIGARAVPALSERLRAGPTNDTTWVVRALIPMGPEAKAAAPELAKLIRSPNPIADYSVIALARIGADAVPLMTNFLTDTNVAMRVRASSFFWQTGTNSLLATNVLLQAANDPDPVVRGQIWNALAASRAPLEFTRPVWLRGLRDPVPSNVNIALSNLSHDYYGVHGHSNELAEVFRTHPDLGIRTMASNILTAYAAWPKK